MRRVALDYQGPTTRANRTAPAKWVLCLTVAVAATLAVSLGLDWVSMATTHQPRYQHGDLHNIQTALDAFHIETGRYPTTSEGLQALIKPPRGLKGWDGPYLKSLPLDPWGNAYIYRCPGAHNPNRYDLLSVGPDGREGGDDDIDNWSTQ